MPIQVGRKLFAILFLFLGVLLTFYSEYYLFGDVEYDVSDIVFTGLLSLAFLLASGIRLLGWHKLRLIIIMIFIFLILSPLLFNLLKNLFNFCL
ncbi:hypothetical protein N752_19385 [Desulforamulus aquiferis]|nr:hypothetical protein [Desulforamulus aquiferis]RYD03572.1 hypothetical protein N752_19385 [Desulforamulus aquiferis]